jgi:hypothetical protein
MTKSKLAHPQGHFRGDAWTKSTWGKKAFAESSLWLNIHRTKAFSSAVITRNHEITFKRIAPSMSASGRKQTLAT